MALSSCANIPPNEEGCVRLNYGAACVYTIQGPERRLSEEEWLTQNVGRISFTPGAYGRIRAYLEAQCAKKKKCSKKKLLDRLRYMEQTLCVEGNCEGAQ